MRVLARLTVAATVLTLMPTLALAQTNSTWNGTTGNWNDATRWSTNPLFPNNGQPNAGDTYNALIGSGTVFLNQDITIQNLNLSGGTLDGSSNLTVNDASTWTGSGFMTGSGTTTFNGSLTINPSSFISINRNIINNGTTTWTGNLFINNSTGIWNNQSGSLFDIQNDVQWFNTGAFNNQTGAVLRKSAGTGTSTLQTLNNSGTVQVNSGTLTLTTGSSSSGSTFTLASGTTLNLVSYTIGAGSSITGAGGLINTTSSTINGSFAATGPVEVANSSVATFNAPATFSSLVLHGTLTGTGNITVNGPTDWSVAAFMTGKGTTTFNGPTLINSTSFFTIDRTIFNNSTTTWIGDHFINNSIGTWVNQSGSVFDIKNNQTMFGASAGFINQAGAVFRKSEGVFISDINWVFLNSGTIEALSGAISFNGGFFQNGGNIVLGGGHIINNSPLNFTGGGVIGSGSLGAAVFGSATIAPGFSPGTITFEGDLALGTATVLNFELGALSDLINVNGNLTLDGTLNIAALAGFGPGTFKIIDYTGTLTDDGLDFGSLPGGFNYQLINDSNNTEIDLLVTAAVPEPRTIMIFTVLALGVGTCFWQRRKLIRQSQAAW